MQLKKMTPKEFREMIDDMINDANNPEGEYNKLVTEGAEGVASIREHDPKLADKCELVFTAIKNVIEYVKSKKQS